MPLAIPYAFATAGLNTPLNRLDANFVAIAGYINPRNPATGVIGARPAAGNAGALYVATDQNNIVYVDNGFAWVSTGLTAPSLPEGSFFEFIGIAPPTTPSAGHGRLYMRIGESLEWLDAGGKSSPLTRTLIRQTGAPIKDIVNTTTETTLWTTVPTLKGGTFGTLHAIRILGLFDYFNNSGAGRALTVRVKYGGTTFLTLATTAAGMAASGTRYPLCLEVVIGAIGATNAQLAHGHFNWRVGDSNSDGVTGTSVLWLGGINYLGAAFNTGGVIDSTVDQALEITAQHDTANANLSVRPWALGVELVG